MKEGIICQSCGIEAPTRYVEFYQNIGALVMRFHKSIKGNLCKTCVHRHFWSMSGTTIAIGWLGVISLFIAPIFVINNVIRFLASLGMPAVPEDARMPEVDDAMFERFLGSADAGFGRVNAGEDLGDVCRSMAPRLGMTPGQMLHCFIAATQMPTQAGSTPALAVASVMAPPPLPAAQIVATPPLAAAPIPPAPAQADEPPQLGIGR